MKLTYHQFEILTRIERHQDQKHSQRDLSLATQISLGVVNKTIAELLHHQLLQAKGNSHYQVSLKGYASLEPYRVKKAVFLAAGFGSRLMPITLNTPKPLIMVHGRRIIDTLIDAVLDAGIEDITIVRGYLKEQFHVLKQKYPMIKFLDNPVYNEANNISSMYYAKDLLEHAYVLESDLLLYQSERIRKYEYASCYLGKNVAVTDDWCFYMKKGYISKLSIGGRNCCQMYGISYWNKEDAKKLSQDIENVYHMPGGSKKYWDEVPLKECLDHYQVRVNLVQEGDLVEIDTLNELKQIDPIYNIS